MAGQIQPSDEGIYWAKQKLSDHFDSTDLAPDQWEPVDLYVNGGDPGDPEYWKVFVLGRDKSESPENFFWGPKIEEPR